MRSARALLLAVAIAGGCAPAPVRLTPPGSPGPAAASWTPRASGLLVGELDASVAFDARWFPRDARADTFERADNSGTRPVARTLTPAEGGLIVEVRDGETTLVRSRLLIPADGALRIAESDGSGIASVFDPPALFLPASGRPGDAVDEGFAVRSTGRGIPDNPGSGRATVTPLGAQRVRTPAGVIDAYALDLDLRFRTGPARVAFTQRVWIDMSDRRLGVVASEHRDTVRVFGLTFLDERHASVLREAGEGP